jgi:hypothetical protein
MRSVLFFGCACAITAAASSLAARPTAQSVPGVPADTIAAQQLLYTAYPELYARRLAAIWGRGSSGEVIVRMDDAPDGLVPAPRQPGRALVEATIALDAQQHVQLFSAEGLLTKRNENRALRQAVAAHAGWTDADADAYLETAGAAVGPRRAAALEARVDLARWVKHLGPNLERRGQAFNWRTDPTTKAGWIVDLDAVYPNGRRVPYRLVFEPFDGHLVSISRR